MSGRKNVRLGCSATIFDPSTSCVLTFERENACLNNHKPRKFVSISLLTSLHLTTITRIWVPRKKQHQETTWLVNFLKLTCVLGGLSNGLINSWRNRLTTGHLNWKSAGGNTRFLVKNLKTRRNWKESLPLRICSGMTNLLNFTQAYQTVLVFIWHYG